MHSNPAPRPAYNRQSYTRPARPPSPRRRSPPHHNSQFPPPPPPSAQYWRAWGRPPPPPPTAGSKDDAKARAAAFENIRHVPPPRPASNRSDSERGTNPTHPGLGRSNTTRTPRKSGFDPTDTSCGWEPQATRSSSYATHARPSSATPAFSSVNDGGDDTSDVHTSPSQDHAKPDGAKLFPNRDVPYVEGSPRISTPYMAHLGEKTYFNSDSLRRSASVRDAPRYAADIKGAATTANSPQGSYFRPRSTSPHLRPGASTQPRANSSEKVRQNASATPSRPARNSTGSKPVFTISSDDESSDDESVSHQPNSSDQDQTSATNEADTGPFGKRTQRRNFLQPKSVKERRASNMNGSWTAPNQSPITSPQSQQQPL